MKKHALKIREALRSGLGLGIMGFMLTTSLTGCEKDCGFGDHGTPAIISCDTEVTVAPASCASGAFQNQWLKLDNGEWLQPFENQTAITAIQPGQRYRIAYEVMKADKRYDYQVTCLALPPTGKAIRLLCMTPMEEPTANCDTYVTARRVECSQGAWGDIWLQLDNGHYLQPWKNKTNTQTLTEGGRYKIGFTQTIRDNSPVTGAVCAAMPQDTMAWNPQVVAVHCLEDVTKD